MHAFCTLFISRPIPDPLSVPEVLAGAPIIASFCGIAHAPQGICNCPGHGLMAFTRWRPHGHAGILVMNVPQVYDQQVRDIFWQLARGGVTRDEMWVKITGQGA